MEGLCGISDESISATKLKVLGRLKDCHPLQAIINIFGSTTNSKEQSPFSKLMSTQVIHPPLRMDSALTLIRNKLYVEKHVCTTFVWSIASKVYVSEYLTWMAASRMPEARDTLISL